ncbi:MAG: hypothetical protein WC964_01280 [Acholeplasmataceae bacterium]
MEQVKQKRVFYFVTFLIALTIYIAAVVLSWVLLKLNEDMKLSIILGLSVVFVGVALWFRPRIVYYATVYQWIRLKEGKELVKKTDYNLASAAFVQRIIEQKFKPYKDNQDFLIAYRHIRDPKELALKRGSLEVIVLLKDDNATFENPFVSNAINQIEESLRTDRKRFSSYVVLQIKLVDEITGELIEKADQVVFDKHSFVRVSVINVLYANKTKSLYYLHNKEYYPSFHYQYALSLLESLIL